MTALLVLFAMITGWMFAHMLVVIMAVVILWVILHQTINFNKSPMVCRNCGSVASAKVMSPRNIWIEIILWFSYLIPGVLYTLWCYHNTRQVCSKCGSPDIVPADSPVGRKLVSETARDITPQSETFR